MQISRSIESVPPRYRHVFGQMIVREVTEFSAFLDLVRREQAENPDVAVFITLDDLDQALYTSMHATESDDLEIDTDDLDFLADPQAEEVSQRRQFVHTCAQLAAPGLRVAWSDLRGSREGAADDIDALVAVNSDPLKVIDDVVVLLHVPVHDRTAAIAAIPNGYFSEDWNTFQNHAATRHLADAYGYRPLGIGASWIGFVRDEPLSIEAAAALVAELATVYGAPDSAGWNRLAAELTRQSTLFLGYTGNFAD